MEAASIRSASGTNPSDASDPTQARIAFETVDSESSHYSQPPSVSWCAAVNGLLTFIFYLQIPDIHTMLLQVDHHSQVASHWLISYALLFWVHCTISHAVGSSAVSLLTPIIQFVKSSYPQIMKPCESFHQASPTSSDHQNSQGDSSESESDERSGAGPEASDQQQPGELLKCPCCNDDGSDQCLVPNCTKCPVNTIEPQPCSCDCAHCVARSTRHMLLAMINAGRWASLQIEQFHKLERHRGLMLGSYIPSFLARCMFRAWALMGLMRTHHMGNEDALAFWQWRERKQMGTDEAITCMSEWAYYEMVYQATLGVTPQVVGSAPLIDQPLDASFLDTQRAASLEYIQTLSLDQLHFDWKIVSCLLDVIDDHSSGALTTLPQSPGFVEDPVERMTVSRQIGTAVNVMEQLVQHNIHNPERNSPARRDLLKRTDALLLLHCNQLHNSTAFAEFGAASEVSLPSYSEMGTSQGASLPSIAASHHISADHILEQGERVLDLALPQVQFVIQLTPTPIDLSSLYEDDQEELKAFSLVDILNDPVLITMHDPAAKHCRNTLLTMIREDTYYSDSFDVAVADAISEYLTVCRCASVQQAFLALLKLISNLRNTSKYLASLIAQLAAPAIRGNLKWFQATTLAKWNIPIRSTSCGLPSVNIPQFSSVVDSALLHTNSNAALCQQVVLLDTIASWIGATGQDGRFHGAWVTLSTRLLQFCFSRDIFWLYRAVSQAGLLHSMVADTKRLLLDFVESHSQYSSNRRNALVVLFLQSSDFNQWCTTVVNTGQALGQSPNSSVSSSHTVASDPSSPASSFGSVGDLLPATKEQDSRYNAHGNFFSHSLSPPRCFQVDWAASPLSRYKQALSACRYRLEGDDWLNRIADRFPRDTTHKPRLSSRSRVWRNERYQPGYDSGESMHTDMSSSFSSNEWMDEQPLASWIRRKYKAQQGANIKGARAVIPVDTLPEHLRCPSSVTIAAAASRLVEHNEDYTSEYGPTPHMPPRYVVIGHTSVATHQGQSQAEAHAAQLRELRDAHWDLVHEAESAEDYKLYSQSREWRTNLTSVHSELLHAVRDKGKGPLAEVTEVLRSFHPGRALPCTNPTKLAAVLQPAIDRGLLTQSQVNGMLEIASKGISTTEFRDLSGEAEELLAGNGENPEHEKLLLDFYFAHASRGRVLIFPQSDLAILDTLPALTICPSFLVFAPGKKPRPILNLSVENNGPNQRMDYLLANSEGYSTVPKIASMIIHLYIDMVLHPRDYDITDFNQIDLAMFVADASDAFYRVPIASTLVGVQCARVAGFTIVPMCCTFGWKRSVEVFSHITASILAAHKSDLSNVTVKAVPQLPASDIPLASTHGAGLASHSDVATLRADLPEKGIRVATGHVDDFMAIAQASAQASAGAASDLLFAITSHLGMDGVSVKKFGESSFWSSLQKVIGAWFDTDNFTVTMPQDKVQQTLDLLNSHEFRADAKVFPIDKCASLRGKLRWALLASKMGDSAALIGIEKQRSVNTSSKKLVPPARRCGESQHMATVKFHNDIIFYRLFMNACKSNPAIATCSMLSLLPLEQRLHIPGQANDLVWLSGNFSKKAQSFGIECHHPELGHIKQYGVIHHTPAILAVFDQATRGRATKGEAIVSSVLERFNKLCAEWVFRDLIAGRPCIVLEDNQGSVACINSGYANNVHLQAMQMASNLRQAVDEAPMEAFYTHTENMSFFDKSSRLDQKFVDRMNADLISLGMVPWSKIDTSAVTDGLSEWLSVSWKQPFPMLQELVDKLQGLAETAKVAPVSLTPQTVLR